MVRPKRVPEVVESADARFGRTWKRMRWCSRCFWMGVMGTVVMGILVINGVFGHAAYLITISVAGLVGLLVTVAYGFCLYSIRCPRCEERFAGTNLSSILRSKHVRAGSIPQRCQACGLDFGVDA